MVIQELYWSGVLEATGKGFIPAQTIHTNCVWKIGSCFIFLPRVKHKGDGDAVVFFFSQNNVSSRNG